MAVAPAGLSDKEVAFSGRLASMSRREATQRVRDAGGRPVRSLSDQTAYLVVGQHSSPFSDDAPQAPLARARELQAAGSALRVLSEAEFLGLLDLREKVDELSRLFTSAQVARITGVTAAAIRAWVRAGLLRPARLKKRLAWFDFKEIVMVRALRLLSAEGATPARISRSLSELASWLPDAPDILSRLEEPGSGRSLRVRLPGGSLAESSGQLVFDFTEPQPDRPQTGQPRILPLTQQPEIDDSDSGPQPVPDSGGRDLILLPSAQSIAAEEWFERGLQAEAESDLTAAIAAYEQALTVGGPDAEVAFNLGNVLYATGRFGDAAARYLAAVEIEPDYVEAWNNLGIALTDAGKLQEAITVFKTALTKESDYADVHSNMAEVYATQGKLSLARHHWRAYLIADPHSSWAQHVRRRLAETK